MLTKNDLIKLPTEELESLKYYSAEILVERETEKQVKGCGEGHLDITIKYQKANVGWNLNISCVCGYNFTETDIPDLLQAIEKADLLPF